MNFFSILSLALIVYFFTTITAAIHDHVSINCGSAGNFASVDGREWIGDAHKKVPSSMQITGSSTSSSVAGESIVSADQAQYKTARISRSRFSYTFHLNPGQKFILLHFNPVSYRGFKGLKDLFTVEAGPFTLHGNFSASLTADALGRGRYEKYFAKEFCINIEENQPLDIIFYPSQDDTYAFINGIEIISVPKHLSYFRSRVQVVSLKSLVHIYDYNHTALEIIHRQNVKPSDDFVNMFRVRTTTPMDRTNKLHNNTWKIAVDVRFRYLVRIHFCEFGLKLAKETQMIFKILISEIRVDDNIHLVEKRENNEFLQYRDYMTTIQGHKQDGKHNLLISIESTDELMNRNGPFKGFEVLKLSNLDNSLASPNPQPPARGLSFPTAQNLIRVWGDQNIIATAAVIVFALVNIIVYKLQQFWEDNFTEDENKPSARARRLCRHFSLAEIEAATQNFNHEFVIGNGGFGKVYKGIIDNGQETVAIKRLKYSSNQGAREFWTEIETLSELRHVDLVSLIGYCNEQQEMILVYEYMIHGTLRDHLFKQAMGNNHSSSLSWNQCLNICIGAGRGLDYLHTGHGIIHRDVKASNILLDENFTAKVSDFGLAKPENICDSQSHASTNVKGTPGHIDPYYIRTHKLTRKSDVYAFGVVLLEVLCGRPALDPRLEEEERSLATWFRENIGKGDIEKITSSNIRGEILPDSLKAFVRLAVSCLDDEPKKRPTMTQVVLQLEFALHLQEKPNFLVSKEISTANGSPWDEFFKSAKASTSGRNELELDNGRRASLEEDCAMEVEVTKFDWKTIEAATFGFSDSRIICKGEGAIVYKAVLPTRQVVAVKRTNSFQIKERMLKLEVYCLSKYKHPNIMKLLGNFIYCKERILVYEFIENTGLDAILFGKQLYRLSWRSYFKIIVGIAHGVSCLHRHSEHRKYYCNLEPRNIFLDSDMNPKIALNYFITKSNVAISTSVYTPPGGHEANQIFVSDIYAFGVMVLEILSGMKHDPYVEYRNLIKTVRKLWSGNRLEELLCSSMGNEFSRGEATRCIEVALLCTQSEPARRPDIYAVLGALQGDQALEVEMREAEIGLSDS